MNITDGLHLCAGDEYKIESGALVLSTEAHQLSSVVIYSWDDVTYTWR